MVQEKQRLSSQNIIHIRLSLETHLSIVIWKFYLVPQQLYIHPYKPSKFSILPLLAFDFTLQK